jgi:hypothetical protein
VALFHEPAAIALLGPLAWLLPNMKPIHEPLPEPEPSLATTLRVVLPGAGCAQRVPHNIAYAERALTRRRVERSMKVLR